MEAGRYPLQHAYTISTWVKPAYEDRSVRDAATALTLRVCWSTKR
jgi:hypothetical protein